MRYHKRWIVWLLIEEIICKTDDHITNRTGHVDCVLISHELAFTLINELGYLPRGIVTKYTYVNVVVSILADDIICVVA